MELDITQFFNSACPRDYSASVAEIGRDAGPSTWRAANDDSEDYPLIDTDEKREAFRAFVRSAGAWDDAEISAFSDQELNALCIQWIAGDMRESGLDSGPDWAEYSEGCEAGRYAGRIFRGDDARVYFSIEG